MSKHSYIHLHSQTIYGSLVETFEPYFRTYTRAVQLFIIFLNLTVYKSQNQPVIRLIKYSQHSIILSLSIVEAPLL